MHLASVGLRAASDKLAGLEELSLLAEKPPGKGP